MDGSPPADAHCLIYTACIELGGVYPTVRKYKKVMGWIWRTEGPGRAVLVVLGMRNLPKFGVPLKTGYSRLSPCPLPARQKG